MWPILLDMSKEESIQNLRNLEFEAYSHLVSALRAQGPLNSNKRKLLQETSVALSISQDRQKAEIRRAVNDEKLNTIAYHVTGLVEYDDWALEGRRIIPLLPRMAPQTAYSAIADEAAENAYENNKLVCNQNNTEMKQRQTNLIQTTQIPMIAEASKIVPFRIPETNKSENDCNKKRKLSICTENSTLAQHLLGSAKMSRIQHVYKQRMKTQIKEQSFKIKKDNDKYEMNAHLKPTCTKTLYPLQQTFNGPKLNVLQNISLQSTSSSLNETSNEQGPSEINYNTKKLFEPISNHHHYQASCSLSNENQAPKLLTTNLLKQSANLTFKHLTTTVTTTTCPTLPVGEQKTIKVCPIRKPITKHVGTNQKLIVVSNTQTIPTSSILHKTLSVPFVKNISMKNLEKLKIVTTPTTPTTATVPITVGTTNLQITTNNNNLNSSKTKLLTVKTNPTKKVINLSQLIGGKTGIKVLPIGGKIVGKTCTTTTTPLIIMNSGLINKGNNAGNLQIPALTTNTMVVNQETVPSNCGELLGGNSEKRENGKSLVLADILRVSENNNINKDKTNDINNEQIVEKIENDVITKEDKNGYIEDMDSDSIPKIDEGFSDNTTSSSPMETDDNSQNKEIHSNQDNIYTEITNQEELDNNNEINENVETN